MNVLVLFLSGALTSAAADPSSPWGTSSALIMPVGRVELGLFSAWRWAARPDLEVSTQPLGDLYLPAIAAKKAWGSSGDWHFASEHRFALTSFMLGRLATEGSLGLLPADSEIPFSFALTTRALATRVMGERLLTVQGGLMVAPRFGEGSVPILDFPFLYQRFSALSTLATADLGVTLEGALSGWLAFRAELLVFAWPGAQSGGAIEHAGALSLRPSEGFQLEVGYRLSLADYPIGLRLHVLPTLDLVFAL